jgi:uncharacterized membrane protein YjgN (DUF898 family)
LELIIVNQWVPGGPPPPSSLPPRPPVPVVFSGERPEFFRLAARGAALEFVTLGFYRFWLATDIRRHLWANTEVDGDAAEYTGRGKELLVGFLFALAVLVPVYLAYFLIGLEVERLKAFASLPLFVFFYLFGQFAIYRARRYRLTRTIWRGVRFWMDGSGWAYAARAAFWTLLMILTLGLILPWRAAALERYKMRHCYYGELQGGFDGRGSKFFKRGWWLWLVAALLLVGPGTLVEVLHFLGGPVPQRLAQSVPFITLLFLLAAPFIYAVFKAVEWRWWLSGIHFGQVRFESTLARGALVGLYWKVIGWFLLAGALSGAFLLLCAWLIATISKSPMINLVTAGNLQGNAAMIVLTGIGYLVFILAMNVVFRMYLMCDLWARIAASTSVHHIDAATNVSARGDLASAFGEGLADSLDVVGF